MVRSTNKHYELNGMGFQQVSDTIHATLQYSALLNKKFPEGNSFSRFENVYWPSKLMTI